MKRPVEFSAAYCNFPISRTRIVRARRSFGCACGAVDDCRQQPRACAPTSLGNASLVRAPQQSVVGEKIHVRGHSHIGVENAGSVTGHENAPGDRQWCAKDSFVFFGAADRSDIKEQLDAIWIFERGEVMRLSHAMVVACTLLAACSSSGGGAGATVDTIAAGATEARGQYLVDHLLVCGECHTPSGADGKPDSSKYLAGSRSYDFSYAGKIVSVYAENLTSHATEGLGMWSDADVRRALTRGIDDENVAMWPIMPYPEYALLKPEDVDSILKYLRTVPSNGNVVPPDELPDPDPPPPPLKDAEIPHTTLSSSDPNYAAAERGRYLAAVACVQCHTPATAPGIPDLSKAFAGGRVYQVRVDSNSAKPMSFTSTNLTPDATGLAGWSVDDIVQSMKTNTEKGTHRSLCVTMPGGPGRMGDLTDGDLTDIATYIHNLAPIANGPFTCGGV